MLAACLAAPAFAVEETVEEALAREDAETRIELQLTAGEFADAAVAAERRVDAVEDASGRYALALKRPLTLLGDALLGMGDGPGALAAYERALHVARVNLGLFDPSQVDVVYREAVVHATMGDQATADARHGYAFNVLLRAYGRDDPRLVPGLFTLAEWHQEHHRVFSARRLFDRAVGIAASQFPPGDPRMIRALRGVAATFRDERFPRNLSATRNQPAMSSFRDSARNRAITVNNFAPGERALITVVKLKQSNPDATDTDIGEAMLELGDWYLLFEKYDRAFALYERVWQLLEEDAARIRIPLDAGTYTVEVADRSGAADSAYALAISLVEPPSMSYPTFDRAGRVEAAGSYSILATADGMPRDVETYEELRGEAADAFRLHVADGGGASHAAFLATVEAGDVFEWRAASDCWTRYQVTSATPPANGATAREFGVKWVTYAYSGCSGALPGTLAATVSWYPPDVGGVSLASPVVHGAFQLKPSLWTGAVQPGEVFDTPGGYPPLQSPEVFTTDVTVARSFPYWRDPELPRGWAFMSATGGGLLVSRGYCASYSGLGGYLALEVCGEHALGKWFATDASWLADRETDQPRLGVLETRMVAGRPAVIDFSPKGSFHYEGFLVSAIVYDAATDSLYAVSGRDPSLRGDNVDGVIAIARSLFERAAPAPPVTGHGRASASGHDVWYGAASGLRAGEVR